MRRFEKNDIEEPEYFRGSYPDDDPLYSWFDFLFPTVSKAYCYEDERYSKYTDHAAQYIESIFGTTDNLRKSYMKRLEGYIIITEPDRFVKDYNDMVEGLQTWCRINHITYRAIGEPDPRVYKLKDLYERNREYLKKAEEQYEKWDKLRCFCEKQTIGSEAIKLRYPGAGCNCFKDVIDDIYGWYIEFDNIGHIGEYRLAADVQFDRMVDIFHSPVQLPDVHVKLYLTMQSDICFNPWANANDTYPVKAGQISDTCRTTISGLVYSAIQEFDRKNKKHRLLGGPKKNWGNNFFRMIKEDFDPVKDIKILFEDGKVWKGSADTDPEETVEKYKRIVEEIKPYLE